MKNSWKNFLAILEKKSSYFGSYLCAKFKDLHLHGARGRHKKQLYILGGVLRLWYRAYPTDSQVTCYVFFFLNLALVYMVAYACDMLETKQYMKWRKIRNGWYLDVKYILADADLGMRGCVKATVLWQKVTYCHLLMYGVVNISQIWSTIPNHYLIQCCITLSKSPRSYVGTKPRHVY